MPITPSSQETETGGSDVHGQLELPETLSQSNQVDKKNSLSVKKQKDLRTSPNHRPLDIEGGTGSLSVLRGHYRYF